MKKLIIAALISIPLVANSGGLDQFLARRIGGENTIELEQGQRLVNVTWKDDDSLWLLIKNEPNQKPTTYEFKESSVFGILEGTVRIIEK